MKKESYQYFRLENGIKVIQKEVDSPITHVGMVVTPEPVTNCRRKTA